MKDILFTMAMIAPAVSSILAPKVYSQDLLNNLFRYPYTKIEYLMPDLNISRNTAIRYLEQLQQIDLVQKRKIGRDNFYINKALTEMLINPE